MRKILPHPFSPLLYLVFGWLILICAAYGRLLLHPGLHTVCPENDTWNLPLRWSVLSSLREGKLPLWNPLSAFGIPWLATWQTECFYPGTLLFIWFGLSAWNYSGILHLFILSLGIYMFLREAGVKPFWAFLSAVVGLLNACAYNHLGSNSSMDTMAWIPWIFRAARQKAEGKPGSGLKLAVLNALQTFAGYPQIILYTVLGCFSYAISMAGFRSSLKLLAPLGGGLLLSACQWVPSVEYFFLNCVRLPAIHDNPHFYLPLQNLRTFWNPEALAANGVPDYVASPTYFYFNFHSGLLPLAVVILGFLRFHRLKSETRFFLCGFLFLILWAVGFFLGGLTRLHIPFPAFFEPAKSWVLIVVFELFVMGQILNDLFLKPGRWKWAILFLAALNLLYPIWTHPLERNLVPPDPTLEAEAQKIKTHLESGRALVLTGPNERASLYTPLPDPRKAPLFKHFIPNSNLFAGIPLANFYGSTWPTWGTMDAEYYLQYDLPYRGKALLDLLGVDLLLLNADQMPEGFERIWSEDDWTLWKNPGSVGSHFMFPGLPHLGTRKEAFEAFTNAGAEPLKDLYWDPQPLSHASRYAAPLDAEDFEIGGGQKGFLVVTQNAMPGWRAWVDGRPTELYLADGLFQGIPFDSGTKLVQLSYEPASFRLGLFLSLVACSVLIGLLVLSGGRLSSSSFSNIRTRHENV